MRGRGDITRAQRSSGRCVELQSGRPAADKAARDPPDGLRVNRFRAEPDPVPSSRRIGAYTSSGGGFRFRGRAFRGRHVVVVPNPDPTRISSGDPQHRGLVLHRQVGLLRPVCVCVSLCVCVCVA
jgi:hypothetical protein